jgi:hypothetical protein
MPQRTTDLPPVGSVGRGFERTQDAYRALRDLYQDWGRTGAAATRRRAGAES